MQKLFFMVGGILCVLSLSGCEVAPRRDTIDAISSQLKSAVSQPSQTISDESVANALLPPIASLAGQLPKAKPVLDERFNVSFNNVPAQQFFASIVSGTRYNMLVHPDVSGVITANLKDVTLFEALDAVRDLYGYDYTMVGSRITIKPLTMQTRMFQVNYLVGNRRGSSSLRVTSTSISNSGTNSTSANSSNTSNSNTGSNNQNNSSSAGNSGSQGDGSSVRTSSVTDFWTELQAAIEAIVGDKSNGHSVVISPQSGVILVRAMPDELRNVDLYLKATQVSVERQVILEAKILEVELNDSFQSGVNWAGLASSGTRRLSSGYLAPGSLATVAGGSPSLLANAANLTAASAILTNPAGAAGSLFGIALQTSNFSALISFLESQGKVHVLSSPRIATLNNQKALLKIGTDEFFVTGATTTTTSSAAGSTTTPSVTVAPFFSGVVLDVTPQIDSQGNIILHVHPAVSQVSTVIKGINLGSAGAVSLPLASSATSEMDSVVRGQDGRVVAIGGLMRQSSTTDNSQLPGAGDLPVLGGLFRNKAQINQKRELVVLIKPTIVESASGWDNDLIDANRRIQQLDADSEKRK